MTHGYLSLLHHAIEVLYLLIGVQALFFAVYTSPNGKISKASLAFLELLVIFALCAMTRFMMTEGFFPEGGWYDYVIYASNAVLLIVTARFFLKNQTALILTALRGQRDN